MLSPHRVWRFWLARIYKWTSRGMVHCLWGFCQAVWGIVSVHWAVLKSISKSLKTNLLFLGCLHPIWPYIKCCIPGPSKEGMLTHILCPAALLPMHRVQLQAVLNIRGVHCKEQYLCVKRILNAGISLLISFFHHGNTRMRDSNLALE